MHEADLVVTISQDARQRLIQHLNLEKQRVDVIPLAGDIQHLPDTGTNQKNLDLSKPYIFYPANDWPHKRHDLLLQIMRNIWQKREDISLVLTGWHDTDAMADLAFRNSCLSEKIVNLGYIAAEMLPSLYQNAEALLFVSKYEGFGMPILEAMQNGCPVICAPLTSIPEIAGNAALYISSDDPVEWARAFLEDLPPKRDELIEKGYQKAKEYSWEKTQDQWRQIFEHYLTHSYEAENKTAPLVFLQELQAWADNYAIAQQELSQKEQIIGLQKDVLIDREQTIIELKQTIVELKQTVAEINQIIVELNQIIHSFRHSLKFWLRNGALHNIPLLRHIASFLLVIKNFFLPKIGVLEQYPPRDLEIPPRYRKVYNPSHTPIISIVTPSYNQGEFVERTVLSIFEQEYPNLEYIIQDGKSNDDTLDVLNPYIQKLKHFESRDDNGQAHAINLGFQHATGEIMAFLNADDLLLPGTLSYVANYFSRHPEVDVIYGHRVIINEDDQEIGRWVLPPHDSKVILWADYIPQETLFWRRSLWEKSGGRMDETFRFALDWDLILRYHNAGAKFKRLPRFLGAFRLHSQQKTSSQIDSIGLQEMNRLRKRVLKRDVGEEEIGTNIKPYLRRSAIYHKLYRLGILH